MAQLVAPPEMLKLIAPAGARALAVPVTVAVKITEPPSVSAPDAKDAVRATGGVTGATTVGVVAARGSTAL